MGDTVTNTINQSDQFDPWFGQGFHLDGESVKQIQKRLQEFVDKQQLRLTVGEQLSGEPIRLEHNSSIFHIHGSNGRTLVELVLTPEKANGVYVDLKMVADRSRELQDQLGIAIDPQKWFGPILTFLHQGKTFSPWITVDYIDSSLEYFIPWIARQPGAFAGGVPGFDAMMELTHFKGFEAGLTNPIDVYRELILKPRQNYLKPWSRKEIDGIIEQLSPRRVYLRGFYSEIPEVKSCFNFTIERILKTWPGSRLGTLSPTEEVEESVTTILFIVSDPSDLTRLRVAAELREIAEKLAMSKLRDKFRLEQRLAVRPADLTQVMLDLRSRIVHFSGHGTYDGRICLEDNYGRAHAVSPEALVAMFKEFSNHIRCVLLNACYSENQANAIGQHVDYVIGIKQAVSDESALAFSVGFYQAIGAGSSFDEAYRMGCIQTKLNSNRISEEPVLLVRKQ